MERLREQSPNSNSLFPGSNRTYISGVEILEQNSHLIFTCKSEEDIVTALNYAKEQGMKAITNENMETFPAGNRKEKELLIDVSNMKEIIVDRENRVVTAEAGATIGEINSVLQLKGMAAISPVLLDNRLTGTALSTGAGFIKGLDESLCDAVISICFLTEEGKVTEVNAVDNSSLYWKLRAGKEPGIITTVKFQVQYRIPEVLALSVIYDYKDRRKIAEGIRIYNKVIPDAVSYEVKTAWLPDSPFYSKELRNRRVIAITGHYEGDPSLPEGEELIQPLRELAEPILDNTDVVLMKDLYKKQSILLTGKN